MNSDVVKVSVDAVRTGDSPRLDGEDEDHARALAELGTGLPPITVHRGTMRVIDGAHRLRAARLLGHTEIAARFYDGDEDDAFVLAVTMNASHGLPLTLADRTAAAARILTARPQLSDRRIGKVTGLSGTTVGAIRSRSTDQNQQSNSRVGSDGRARPLNSATGRLLASELLVGHPELSLREIARAAGVSSSTAHDVRERLRSGRDPLPAKQRAAMVPAAAEAERAAAPARSRVVAPVRTGVGTHRARSVDRAVTLRNLRNDPSLRFSEAGRALLRWLDQNPAERTELGQAVSRVPAHWAGAVAQLIRDNAAAWTECAEALERRADALDGEAGPERESRVG